MKLQHLTVIFIIIIIPITIVMSEYIRNKITIEETRMSYDNKLLNSTFDTVKAYQLNTVNNVFGDVETERVKNLEAAANTFYSSLSSNFNYTGYRSEVMKEYVPAIVFTLYDGYYIYSPYTNTLTSEELDDGIPRLKSEPDYNEYTDGNSQKYSNVAKDYANGKILSDLKPYIYYSCRYEKGSNYDFNITYTLDNYITVQGIVDGKYENKSGYLLSEVEKGLGDNSYTYNGVTFSKGDYEEPLSEWLSDRKEYKYVKINGVKYYQNNIENINEKTIKESIFSINKDGSRNYSECSSGDYKKNLEIYTKFNNAITRNISAFKYYESAYNFTKWVNEKLKDITTENAVIYDNTGEEVDNTRKSEIFGNSDINNDKIFTGVYENPSSSFNRHRQAVIRNVIETNLSTAISSFSANVNSNNIEFLMPKLSETDWEIVENNVCCISFLQGLSLGYKRYNGYSVVANTLTKEYVNENDIYILKNDGTYCRANDKTLDDSDIISGKPAGIYKMDFELRKGLKEDGTYVYYNPKKGYSGSYTSIMGSSGIASVEKIGMYAYMNGLDSTNFKRLKEVYYTALGRERWCAFNVHNINEDISTEYFLKDYE